MREGIGVSGKKELLPLGTMTPYGTVEGYHLMGGKYAERYYFLLASDGVVSYFPEDAVKAGPEFTAADFAEDES